MTAPISALAPNMSAATSHRTVGEAVTRISLATVAGAVIAGGAAAFFHRTAAGLRMGLTAGAIGGAVTGVATLNLGNSNALKYGLLTAGIGGALAAAIMPGLHGMPVSPLAAGFEVAIAGATLGGIGGGIADIAS